MFENWKPNLKYKCLCTNKQLGASARFSNRIQRYFLFFFLLHLLFAHCTVYLWRASDCTMQKWIARGFKFNLSLKTNYLPIRRWNDERKKERKNFFAFRNCEKCSNSRVAEALRIWVGGRKNGHRQIDSVSGERTETAWKLKMDYEINV